MLVWGDLKLRIFAHNMPFFLINNPEISSQRWVVLIPEDELHAHYVAELCVFPSEIAARIYCERVQGLLIPGKWWVLRFAGVVNSPGLPVSYRYDEEIPSFLEQAAKWSEGLSL
jgi:hypothetical protein